MSLSFLLNLNIYDHLNLTQVHSFPMSTVVKLSMKVAPLPVLKLSYNTVLNNNLNNKNCLFVFYHIEITYFYHNFINPETKNRKKISEIC